MWQTNEMKSSVDLTDVVYLLKQILFLFSFLFLFLFLFLFSYTYTNIAKYLLLFYKNITVRWWSEDTHVRYMSIQFVGATARRESSSFAGFFRLRRKIRETVNVEAHKSRGYLSLSLPFSDARHWFVDVDRVATIFDGNRHGQWRNSSVSFTEISCPLAEPGWTKSPSCWCSRFRRAA